MRHYNLISTLLWAHLSGIALACYLAGRESAGWLLIVFLVALLFGISGPPPSGPPHHKP